jgi:hypothetical protein
MDPLKQPDTLRPLPRNEGWAGEPHECECEGPDDSCPACSALTQCVRCEISARLDEREADHSSYERHLGL